MFEKKEESKINSNNNRFGFVKNNIKKEEINNTKEMNNKRKVTEEYMKNENLVKDTHKKLNSKNKVEFEGNVVETKKVNNTNNNNLNNNQNSSKLKLKIIPLGGLNEIGKNMTVFEYGSDIIIIDCGLAFPGDEMLGVDLVIPDITYLEKNKEKVKALFLTHGHEDHIGSIPFFLKKINVPIYGTKLTLGLVKAKLVEHKLDKTTDLRYVEPRDVIAIGKMKIEFIRVTHSIADSCAIAITTPEGVVVHTGDFKVDYTPIDGGMMDFSRFAELGSQGVTLLMSDSTNVERPGHTMSERKVGAEFDRIFINCNKRIIVATFASNIHRMQQIINTAVKCKRKVAVVGRSMVNVIKVGTELRIYNSSRGNNN